MANVSATIRAKATIEVGQSSTIFNVPCAVANTEYSQSLPAGTKKFLIRVRGNAKMQLSFTALNTGTLFITIPMGCNWTEDAILISNTIYFQTNKASQIVEIIAWA